MLTSEMCQADTVLTADLGHVKRLQTKGATTQQKNKVNGPVMKLHKENQIFLGDFPLVGHTGVSRTRKGEIVCSLLR